MFVISVLAGVKYLMVAAALETISTIEATREWILLVANKKKAKKKQNEQTNADVNAVGALQICNKVFVLWIINMSNGRG